MNTYIYKGFTFIFAFTLLFGSTAYSQTTQVRATQDAINKIIEDAGKRFREGLFDLNENRRSESAEKFDRSVEAFLFSAINIQSDQRLQSCYSQLLETVFRIEFPSETNLPQIGALAATCGWQWNAEDFKLAESVVAKMDPKRPADVQDLVAVNPSNQTRPDDDFVGFNSQEFEASPLDELSRLELTPEELDIEGNPEAQRQYQYIQYAVENRSLGFSFQVHPMIQQFINYYRGRGRRTMEIGLYRSGMFMSMARRIFREEGVPENVAWLGQVESAWKPTAMSWASASGLWQFIPGTGARFGLRRTAHVDERNSFDEATRASARYLRFLANRYGGNWELAMAAYNCGEGNVDRAIRRAGVSNFWAAYPYLPRETRNYVPNILATILIANNPHQYGFGHVRPAPPLRYDRIRVPASTNLSLIAQASDTTVQYIRYLNPHLRTNITPPEPYIVNVPAGKANEVVAVFRRMPATRVNDTQIANSVRGETWQSISNRTGVSVADLMAANPGMRTPSGKVFVPVTPANAGRVQATSYARPTTQQPAAQPQANFRVVKAQAGDTVAKLATRHGADPAEVAKLNGLLTNSVLGAGREIRVPVK